jgi:hypothetical protein
MNGNGDDKRKPDRKGGGDILVDTGDEQDILWFIDPGGFRLDEERIADGDKKHQGNEDRNDDDGDDPGRPVDPEERAERDKFVKKSDPVRFDCQNRAIKGDVILPEFPGVDIICYRSVGSDQKNDQEDPVHSSFIALQAT